MKTFVINGNDFSDIEGFYDQIEKLFVKNDLVFGRNLAAFDDVLIGGFLAHDIGEPICIKWFNYEKSKKDLGLELTLLIIEIMLDCDRTGHDVKLELW